MVHDEEWYKADQVLHWNFVNGRCLLDAVAYDKVSDYALFYIDLLFYDIVNKISLFEGFLLLL